MSVPSNQFAFQRPVSPGGDFPPIMGTPLDEPSASDSGSVITPDWIIVTKKRDEPIVSNIIPKQDNELWFPTVANAGYELDLSIIVTSASSTPDFKWLLQTTGGLNGEFHYMAGGVVVVGTVMTTTITQSIVANTPDLDRIWGLALPTGTSILGFWWSQNTSSATATIVKAGSRLRYRRLF